MENPTQFDLNEAVRCWRQKVGESPAIAQEALRELESHLVDSVEALRGTGLSAEEAFWVACRRLGSAETLEPEFTKVNPGRVWLQRAVWMIIGFVMVQVVSSLSGVFVNLAALLCHLLQAPSSVSQVISLVSIVLHYGMLIGVLWALWRSAKRSAGLVQRVGSWLRARPVLTPLLVAGMLFAVMVLNNGVNYLLVKVMEPQGFGVAGVIWRSVAAVLVPIILWPSVLAWLLHRARRQATAE